MRPTPPLVPARLASAGLVAAIALTSGLALGQPAAKQPTAAAKQPAAAAKPAPVPAVPPADVSAKLDEQAAALAKATDQLAQQQQALDALRASQTQLAAALERATATSTSLSTRLDAEAAARRSLHGQLGEAALVHSAWPTVTLSGLVQVDGALRQSSRDELRQSGEPLNQDRFSLRRARPRLAARYGRAGGVIELDLNTVSGGQVRPSMVEVSYQIVPELEAELGLAKIPFGYELGQADAERLFLERSGGARALFPGEYDLGLKLAGGWRFVRYAVAAQNGEPVGEKAFALRDPNQAKDLSARAGIETHAGDVTIAAGLSFLTGRGFHAGTPATKDVLVWRDLNEDGVVNVGEIQVLPGQAAQPSASFDRSCVGADAELTADLHAAGKLMVYGELFAATNLDRANVVADPVASGRDLRELAWYLAAVAEPTAWSAVGLRYDRYDPDADAAELRTGDVIPLDQSLSTWALTAALRDQHGRLILEYDHNHNHAGRTTSGVPTNLEDDALTLRAELVL